MCKPAHICHNVFMKEKSRKIIKWIGNSAFILALAIGIGAVVDMIIKRRQLPAGTCPINDSRPWLYLAIGLCVLALVMSFFDKKEKPK